MFLSLMEFAVVNNYMGPVATKAMKGYSDEDLRESIDEFKVGILYFNKIIKFMGNLVKKFEYRN